MVGRVTDRHKYKKLRERAYADARGLWKILEGKLRRRQPRWLWGLCVCVMTVGLIAVDVVKWVWETGRERLDFVSQRE